MRTLHPFPAVQQHVFDPQLMSAAPEAPGPAPQLPAVAADPGPHAPAPTSALPGPLPGQAQGTQQPVSRPPSNGVEESHPKRARKPHTPLGHGNVQTWNVAEPQVAPPSAIPSGSKRKLEDEPADETRHKIRRTVNEVVHPQDPARAIPMTTVVCLHAAVAQKSYGSEKRFLCPPPLVRVEGPTWNMREQLLGMSIVSEAGERSPEQKAALDATMTASFKFLHVSNTAKAKSFQLSLDIGGSNVPGLTPENDPRAPRVWASFDSAPVTIISKPSKKTAKTRNVQSCILAGGPVSLFNRINSQTVRTKYMTIEQSQLCASNTTWSAFNVNLVRRAPDEQLPPNGPQPINYGNEIILTDTQSGISTAPLFIRKVDKGKICDDGGPVSQMQKVALQRVNADGSRHYLSAAGPTSGQVVPAVPGGQHAPSQTHALLFQSARVRDEMQDGKRLMLDEVDDYLCWTIVGISKFQYTFFDASGRGSTVPEMPITPFPTLFTTPVYRPANQQLELTVANFFHEDHKTGGQLPLEVWLGNLGPLRQRIFQTTGAGPLTSVPPMGRGLPSGVDGYMPGGGSPGNGQGGMGMGSMIGPPGLQTSGFTQQAPIHTIVVVDVPSMADIVKSLQADVLPPNGGGPAEQATAAANPLAGKVSPATIAQITGQTMPILFIRTSDGIGYHSGRSVVLESVFAGLDPQHGRAGPSGGESEWVAAAQAAVSEGLAGLTLRVI